MLMFRPADPGQVQKSAHLPRYPGRHPQTRGRCKDRASVPLSGAAPADQFRYIWRGIGWGPWRGIGRGAWRKEVEVPEGQVFFRPPGIVVFGV